jgi:hypothetical protein
VIARVFAVRKQVGSLMSEVILKFRCSQRPGFAMDSVPLYVGTENGLLQSLAVLRGMMLWDRASNWLLSLISQNSFLCAND